MPAVREEIINGLQILSCSPQTAQYDTPLLFVHGAYEGAWCWADHFLPWFAAQGWRAFAVSLSGHAGSAGREKIDNFGIADYVNDLVRTILWLEKSPVLIGHSMGGFVVQRYLEHYPARAAVFMCSVPPHGLLAAQFHFVINNIGDLFKTHLVNKGRLTPALLEKRLFGQLPVAPAILDRFAAALQPESKKALMDMSRINMRRRIDLTAQPPLLVLGAERDALIPPFLVRATAQAYHCVEHIFPEMGHSLTHEKDWEKVAFNINDWLKITLKTCAHANPWTKQSPPIPDNARSPFHYIKTLLSKIR